MYQTKDILIKVLKFLFSFKGRSRKRDYWAGYILALELLILVIIASTTGFINNIIALPNAPTLFTSAFCVFLLPLTLWLSLATITKRLHDLNLSGWYSAFLLMPIIATFIPVYYIGFTAAHLISSGSIIIVLILSIILGIRKGKPEANKYGPPAFENPPLKYKSFYAINILLIAVIILVMGIVSSRPWAGDLKVTATPSVKEIRAEFPFKATLKVENVSSQMQTINYAFCVWGTWAIKGDVTFGCSKSGFYDCISDYPVRKVLAPGEAYTEEMTLCAHPQNNEKTAKFQVGFGESGNLFAGRRGGKTFWSDETVLNVQEKYDDATIEQIYLADLSSTDNETWRKGLTWVRQHKAKSAIPVITQQLNEVMATPPEKSDRSFRLAEDVIALGDIGDNSALSIVRESAQYLAKTKDAKEYLDLVLSALAKLGGNENKASEDDKVRTQVVDDASAHLEKTRMDKIEKASGAQYKQEDRDILRAIQENKFR